jgi:Ca2+-binding EF-hand superfamily protein
LQSNSISELLDAAESLGIEAELMDEAVGHDTPNKQLIRLIIKHIDKDGDGQIDDTELSAVEAMLPPKPPEKQIQMRTLGEGTVYVASTVCLPQF